MKTLAWIAYAAAFIASLFFVPNVGILILLLIAGVILIDATIGTNGGNGDE